jgi:DNA-binding HxlR family transcriptional regulator
MTDKGSAVLYALFGVAKAHGKGYCYPSQTHILHLTQKYEKISMSRRTLNRVLKKLETEGYIERVRRHTKTKSGSLWLRSTLYKLQKRAYKWLGVLRSWVNRFLSPFAVPNVAQHNSSKEEKVIKRLPRIVEIRLKSPIEGRASPSEGIF